MRSANSTRDGTDSQFSMNSASMNRSSYGAATFAVYASGPSVELMAASAFSLVAPELYHSVYRLMNAFSSSSGFDISDASISRLSTVGRVSFVSRLLTCSVDVPLFEGLEAVSLVGAAICCSCRGGVFGASFSDLFRSEYILAAIPVKTIIATIPTVNLPIGDLVNSDIFLIS